MKVYLPRLVRAEGEALAEESVSDVPLGEREEVVLVVEDEPAVRQFSVDALTELGYRVLEADGAASALRLLDGHGEIALLFTDVVMPDVNGAKLAEEARRRRPDLKVLFTTGYTRNAVVHNGVLDPGVELIGKPFTLEELAAKVRRCWMHRGGQVARIVDDDAFLREDRLHALGSGEIAPATTVSRPTSSPPSASPQPSVTGYGSGHWVRLTPAAGCLGGQG